ncbi:insulinase family protein [Hazenella sp. IB182353]|uniref:insulinase family protein n=1 Tax=Polycladospora coralii TaxID=2771432 RepID=UPI001747AC9A|nr:insulinase family protein [Polycladospora coralii]
MIVKDTLTNGVRVIAEKIPHVRSIALGIWIGTGSENEDEGNNGISHFMEHMMFKGTKTKTARQIAETFDEIGGQVNAFTAKEMTCYYAKVIDEHFGTALDTLAEMFFESTFAEEELEKEKKVVIEEIKMVEDTPDDLVHDLLSTVALQNHSLGYTILGSTENVKGFTREDLIQYQADHYTPDNIVISIAGNLPADYLQQIARWFGSFQGKQKAKTKQKPIFIADSLSKAKSTEQSHICMGMPGLAVQDDRIYTMTLLNNILGGNMSSRLFQEIREERGLAYSVFSYHIAHRITGVFAIYAGTANGQEDEVIGHIHETLDKVIRDGLTSFELKKAREQLKGSMMLGLEGTNNRMSRMGRNELLLGKHKTLDETLDLVNRVTIDEMNQLAKELFSSSRALALISANGKIPASFRRN